MENKETVKVVTKVLNGLEVFAKETKWGVFAATYANRTQAIERAAKLGAGWDVYRWGRPFIVGREVKTPV